MYILAVIIIRGVAGKEGEAEALGILLCTAVDNPEPSALERAFCALIPRRAPWCM